jgi:hypothetical protein
VLTCGGNIKCGSDKTKGAFIDFSLCAANETGNPFSENEAGVVTTIEVFPYYFTSPVPANFGVRFWARKRRMKSSNGKLILKTRTQSYNFETKSTCSRFDGRDGVCAIK